MCYYITVLLLLFSSIINGSLPEKNMSSSASDVIVSKELKVDAHPQIIINDNDELNSPKSTTSHSKLMAIVAIQIAKRRLSDSMEKSQRKSISDIQEDETMQKSDTSLFLSPTKTVASATVATAKDPKEEIKQ